MATQHPIRRISARSAGLVLIIIALLVYLVRSILPPFVIAAAIAYALTPAIEWTADKLNVRRIWPALGFFALLVGALLLVSYFELPSVLQALKTAATDLKTPISKAVRGVVGNGTTTILGQSMTSDQVADAAVAALRNWLSNTGNVLMLATMSFATFMGGFLAVVLLFYFLISGPQIGDGFLNLIPPKQRSLIKHLWSHIDPMLRRYFVGLAVVVTFASTAAYIGIGIALGLPHPIILAIATGLLELVPVVGPLISAVLVGLVALNAAKGVGLIIGFTLYAIALRLSIDQAIGPLVLGKAARIHPVLVIFSFLAGAVLFGVVGVILAVPTALVVKIVLSELYGEEPEDVEGKESPQRWRIGVRE